MYAYSGDQSTQFLGKNTYNQNNKLLLLISVLVSLSVLMGYKFAFIHCSEIMIDMADFDIRKRSWVLKLILSFLTICIDQKGPAKHPTLFIKIFGNPNEELRYFSKIQIIISIFYGLHYSLQIYPVSFKRMFVCTAVYRQHKCLKFIVRFPIFSLF